VLDWDGSTTGNSRCCELVERSWLVVVKTTSDHGMVKVGVVDEETLEVVEEAEVTPEGGVGDGIPPLEELAAGVSAETSVLPVGNEGCFGDWVESVELSLPSSFSGGVALERG